MKEYLSDLKLVLFILGIVLIVILFNINYFLSDDTTSQVEIMDINIIKKTELFNKVDQ